MDKSSVTNSNDENWQRITYRLSNGQVRGLWWIYTNNFFAKPKLISEFEERFSNSYQFHTIRFSNADVNSLYHYLHDNMNTFYPKTGSSKPLIVNIYNLEVLVAGKDLINNENNLPPIVAEINYERELLFREFPFLIIIWTDEQTKLTFQRKAPDFWDWLVNVYYFESDKTIIEQERRIQWNKIVESGGAKDEDRLARIEQFKLDFERLEEESQTERILIEKINLAELIAKEYDLANEYLQAKDYYQKAIDMSLHLNDQPNIYTANAYSKLSLIYLSLGINYYDEALKLQEKAIEILKSILPYGHPDIAKAYSSISVIFQNLGNIEKAFETQSLALFYLTHQVDGIKDNIEIANAYHNLSSIYLIKGDLQNALNYCQKAIALRSKILDTNHPDLANSYFNLSSIYRALGNFTGARTYIGMTIEIQERILEKNHPSLAKSYNFLSEIYYARPEFEKALAAEKKAIEIMEAADSTNLDLGFYYDSLAYIYFAMKNYSEALNAIEKAISIYGIHLPPYDFMVQKANKFAEEMFELTKK